MRCAAILLCVVVCAFCPMPALSQGVMPPGISSFGTCSVCGWAITPTAKIGVQRFSTNLGIPVPSISDDSGGMLVGLYNFQTIDMTLRSPYLCVGALALEVNGAGGLGFFAEATGALPREMDVKMAFTGDIAFIGTYQSPWDWKGRHLEWWTLEGGVSYTATGTPISVLAGLRVDHTDVRLTDPRNVNGSLAGQLDSGGDPYYDSEERYGDVQTKIWIPYFGIQGGNPTFKWNLIGSPFVTARTKLPLRWFGTFIPLGQDISDSYYVVKTRNGRFLEANAEFTTSIAYGARLNLWVKASMVHVNGPASLDSTSISETSVFFGQSGTTGTGNATFGRYLASGGLSVNVPF
jgi:hypothetical protein